MYIQNNLSTFLYNHYSSHSKEVEKSLERLSSGIRINRASDDASGLMMADKMKVEVKALEQSVRNGQDLLSVIEIADKTMETGNSILQKVYELALKGSSDTINDDDLSAISKEINGLLEEFDSITQNAQFNGRKIFDGTGDFSFQLPGSQDTQYLYFENIETFNLGTDTAKLYTFKPWESNHVLTKDSAKELVESVQVAMKSVQKERSTIGAEQSRLEFTLNSAKERVGILMNAESRIRDVDVAKETMALTKNQMLSDVSMTMMAQSMQHQQSVLMLLR